ncbi:unnamed protein product [Cuscuta campestris]|uniref:Uncharacterized protein n=1 Tax=Cuscuta campestris TaxID=132261 RepID=A0A484LIP6_9ASTE|nr:unnamed protein product [Cuscuta campestris]
MAVTHTDLAPSPPKTDLGSNTGLFIIVVSILLGLQCFILSLVAEATRSEAIWVENKCRYSGDGKIALMSVAAAFFSLALAMVLQHVYLLIAVSKSPAGSLVYWDPHSDFVKSLTWQAGFFFVATWISFAVGEILLLVGLSVESGHLRNWRDARASCVVVGQGVFSAAGVFGLFTVFMAAGLYMSALRGQRFLQDQENNHREVMAASAFYASPPRSPRRPPPPADDQSRPHMAMVELQKYMQLV